jgi:hypothetical protein
MSSGGLRQFGHTALHNAGSFLNGISQGNDLIQKVGNGLLNFVQGVPLLNVAAAPLVTGARGVLGMVDRIGKTSAQLAKAERAFESGDVSGAKASAGQAVSSMANAVSRRKAAGSTSNYLTSEFERT